jgi:hypothetical protein
MTVRVKGVAEVVEPTDSTSPAGTDVKVITTVFGSSRRTEVLDNPSASVAVRTSSR